MNVKGPILVTGAGGFVGSAVIRQLDLIVPGAEILTPKRGELDLSDERAVDAYWCEFRPQGLVHVAAFARGLGGNLHAKEQAFLLNESVIRSTLLAAIKHGVESLVFCGTVAEYGFPYRSLPLVETDLFNDAPHSGEYFYAQAKRLAHSYIAAIHERWNAKTTHALLTNMYGRGDRFDSEHGHVAAAMLLKFSQARRDSSDVVSLWGSPETTRDFMHVDDAAEAIVRLLPVGAGVVNVASGQARSMEELADCVSQAVGYQGRIEWDSSKPIGIPHRSVSIDKLQSLAPISARSLEDGLVQTVAHERWLVESA